MELIKNEEREALMEALSKAANACLDARGMLDDLARKGIVITMGDWPAPMKEFVEVLRFKFTDTLVTANFLRDALAPKEILPSLGKHNS